MRCAPLTWDHIIFITQCLITNANILTSGNGDIKLKGDLEFQWVVRNSLPSWEVFHCHKCCLNCRFSPKIYRSRGPELYLLFHQMFSKNMTHGTDNDITKVFINSKHVNFWCVLMPQACSLTGLPSLNGVWLNLPSFFQLVSQSLLCFSLLGRVACEISSADELLLTELIFDGIFNHLTVEQCCALLSCFVFDEKVNVGYSFARELF